MSAHFTILKTNDGPKPWHARYVVNGEIVWTTPNHTRMVGVERAIASLARTFGHGPCLLKWNGDASYATEKVIVSATSGVLAVMVRYPHRAKP
jgi:uncharacterized protein YegP (UPF0339 family)